MSSSITGSTGNDRLGGTSDAEVLLGLQGDDTLVGGGGNDTLDGGSGFDEASYEGHLAIVDADLALGLAKLFARNAAPGAAPFETDVLRDIEALYGGKSSDILRGDAKANRLHGADGDDMLDGRAGDDSLFGDGGNDTLTGGTGRDTLDGGEGLDLVSFAGETLAVVADLGGDSGNPGASIGGVNDADVWINVEGLLGGSGDDRLFGNAQANVLDGAAGNDHLQGRDGADTLRGSTGSDTLDGGAGKDLADYSRLAEAVHADLGSGRARGLSAGSNKVDTLIAVEDLRGSALDDWLVGDALANQLEGGAGNDTLDGGAGNDVLDGGAGTDLLRGGAGDDTFLMPSGGDTLDGGGGFDILQLPRNPMPGDMVSINLASGVFSMGSESGTVTLRSIEAIFGGKTTSVLIGDDADNWLEGGTVVGGGGNDTLKGGVIDYRLESADITARLVDGAGTGAGAGSVRFAGQLDTIVSVYSLLLGAGNDSVDASSVSFVDGGAGNDWLSARDMTGGLGDDTLQGSRARYSEATGAVIVNLAEGWARGAAGQDRLIDVRDVVGSAFNDRLSGDASANALSGGAGDDVLEGGAGNDHLEGGSGRNTLLGGEGDDLLWDSGVGSLLDGGAGNDTFIAAGGADALLGGPGDDRFMVSAGVKHIDGGAGYDVLAINPWGSGRASIKLDLRAGTFSAGNGQVSHFVNIERVTLGGGDDTQSGGLFLTTASFDAKSAVTTLSFSQPRSQYKVERLPEAVLALRIAPADDVAQIEPSAIDKIEGVQRLLFSDQALAFGERALDVAKVAFALWSPAIAPSATLFGKGVDWYDQGHSYGELIDFALTYYSGLSDAQLAQTLMTNVKSTRSPSEVLSLITQQGRAAATQLFADDAANMAQVELAGLKSNGIVCALTFGGEQLFDTPG